MSSLTSLAAVNLTLINPSTESPETYKLILIYFKSFPTFHAPVTVRLGIGL